MSIHFLTDNCSKFVSINYSKNYNYKIIIIIIIYNFIICCLHSYLNEKLNFSYKLVGDYRKLLENEVFPNPSFDKLIVNFSGTILSESKPPY